MYSYSVATGWMNAWMYWDNGCGLFPKLMFIGDHDMSFHVVLLYAVVLGARDLDLCHVHVFCVFSPPPPRPPPPRPLSGQVVFLTTCCHVSSTHGTHVSTSNIAHTTVTITITITITTSATTTITERTVQGQSQTQRRPPVPAPVQPQAQLPAMDISNVHIHLYIVIPQQVKYT